MTHSSPGELAAESPESSLVDGQTGDRARALDAHRSETDSPADTPTRAAKRRALQRQAARRTILDATEALMLEKNGSDFSIRALGERSGYSAPTVYHYFGDKDGLIEALLEERVSRLAEQLEQVQPTGDAQADLRAILLAYVDFQYAQRDLHAADVDALEQGREPRA